MTGRHHIRRGHSRWTVLGPAVRRIDLAGGVVSGIALGVLVVAAVLLAAL